MAAGGGTLILGVGNILWADEGFGARALEALAARFAFPGDVALMDGGTQGLALIPLIKDYSRLLLLDAVDFGGAPGSLSVVRDAAVPKFIAARAVSLHQTGMQEVLALAELGGWKPEALTLIGVQPALLDDYGGSLSDVVRGRIDEAVDLALCELAGWGISAEPRDGEGAADLMAPALGLAAYEAGRPAADAACRIGDGRVLPRKA